MKKLAPWLGSLAIIVIIFGTIYGVVQQVQRTDANSPQIQLAEDTANLLNQGIKPSIFATGKVDLSSSLAPFIIIYDKSGNVVSGSGYLNGKIPSIPVGVLTSANNNDFHWVSWQPKGNVRIAAVSVSAHKYYVLTGRSLKEVEINENHTLQIASLGCFLCLAVLGFTYVVMNNTGKAKT